MTIPAFRPGSLFPSAAILTSIARSVNAADGGEGTHGSHTDPLAPVTRLPVVVVAREINGQTPGDPNAGAFLSQHRYTVQGFGQFWAIAHSAIIVQVQPGLVDVTDPEAEEQLFTPAAVYGDAVADAYPWRARGELVRFPVPGDAGEPTGAGYAAFLYGIAPHRGC